MYAGATAGADAASQAVLFGEKAGALDVAAHGAQGAVATAVAHDVRVPHVPVAGLRYKAHAQRVHAQPPKALPF